ALSAVERIVRMVEITPLPQAPPIILGVINVQGQIVPVVNARRRFRLPDREITLEDHLLIARTSRRPVALVADVVVGVVQSLGAQMIEADKVLPGLDYMEGVQKLPDGRVVIHDLDSFLSL